jgi:enoyl-CoA hydratase/carnithine racemase
VGLTGADMGAAYLLPRIVGQGIASELLLLGERVDAQRALAIGLANRVVGEKELLPATMEWAKKLAAGPSLALGLTKRLLLTESHMDLSAAIEQEALAQALMLKGEDHREFHAAWLAKRKPRFTGR